MEFRNGNALENAITQYLPSNKQTFSRYYTSQSFGHLLRDEGLSWPKLCVNIPNDTSCGNELISLPAPTPASQSQHLRIMALVPRSLLFTFKLWQNDKLRVHCKKRHILKQSVLNMTTYFTYHIPVSSLTSILTSFQYGKE